MNTLLRRRMMMGLGGAPTPPTPTPTPEEFHARVRFDGLATIQTDLLLPQNGSIRMSTGGETRKAVQGIFAFKNAAESTNVTSMWLNSSTTSSKRVYAGRYNSLTTESSHPYVNNYTTRMAVCITPHFMQCGSGTSPYSITAGQYPPDTGLQIGSTASGYYYTGAIGYIYIYDNTAQNATSINDLTNNYTPIYTLKPCVFQGEVGYWNVDLNEFYGNTAGVGTLTVED